MSAKNSMKITPNGYDVRIECNRCHASKAGSSARAWAHSHQCAPFEKVYVPELDRWGVRNTNTGHVEIVPTEEMADYNAAIQNEPWNDFATV